MVNRIKFAIPSGSLAKGTFEILGRAGYEVTGQERTYRPKINDPGIELKILRPQEIPIFVGEGMQDLGITGMDWIRETGADVEVLQNLEYGRIRVVVAIPKKWEEIDSLSGIMEKILNAKENVRISTEYLNIATDCVVKNASYQKFFGNAEPLVVTPWWRKGKNQRVSIFLSFGTTEAKPPEDADIIIDASETGATLVQNNLREIETVMDSTAVLISNKNALAEPEKREKIYDVMTLMKGVVDGSKRLHIFVNVRKDKLSQLLGQLPALKNPTIAQLSDKDWYSINTVIEKDAFLRLLPEIRKLAQGIIVYEPRQVLALEEINSKQKFDWNDP